MQYLAYPYFRLAIFSYCVFVSNTVIAAEKPNVKEGAWRVALQMVVPNATGPSTGPMQYDRCLNGDNVANLLAIPANAPCKLLESKLQRDSLTWRLSCSQGGYTSVANGKMSFSGTTLKGEIVTVAEGPQTVKITTNIEGRYLGECVSTKNPVPEKSTGTLKSYRE